MQRTAVTLFVAMTISMAFGSAVAQDFLPLEQLLKTPKDQVEASYSFVRCAGYYKSMVNYIGKQNLPDDVVANSNKASGLNALAAAKTRASNRGGTPNDYFDQVVGNVARIASIYDARMRNN